MLMLHENPDLHPGKTERILVELKYTESVCYLKVSSGGSSWKTWTQILRELSVSLPSCSASLRTLPQLQKNESAQLGLSPLVGPCSLMRPRHNHRIIYAHITVNSSPFPNWIIQILTCFSEKESELSPIPVQTYASTPYQGEQWNGEEVGKLEADLSHISQKVVCKCEQDRNDTFLTIAAGGRLYQGHCGRGRSWLCHGLGLGPSQYGVKEKCVITRIKDVEGTVLGQLSFELVDGIQVPQYLHFQKIS
ncbi:PREDICTED: uncharacterized protein LOC105588772 isoform X2 [Cercocebus atys]|uniref:uncharacterized protein LOC105588772 isoform X2 n=1 Tax=Cercocebus atys TaxID=9531 RepID=UPI0005F4462A|nr:PREDICTED: uncharacterized protein LOC105588772 isoform X2 [Cercocebus atys]